MLFTNKDLWRLILPLVVDLFLSVFVGMADSVMVASAGEDAVSGVSLVDTVMRLLIQVASALASGGAVVAGQYLGCGDKKTACDASMQLVLSSALVSVGVTGLLFVLRPLMLGWLFGQITPQVRACADTYLCIVAFSLPGIVLYQAGAAIFRTMGNSKVTMWISLMMNVINLAGNALLIYCLKMGTAGAAISTLAARTAAAVVILVLLLDEKRDLHLVLKEKIRLRWTLIKKILQIGVPNGMENFMFQMGKILVLSLVSTFGTQAIAANSVANNIISVQSLPGTAVSTGITTVVARCVGKGDFEQTRYYMRRLMVLMYTALSAFNILVFLFVPLILAMYELSPETAELATRMTLIHTIGSVLIWPLTFGLPTGLRAAGDVKFTMIVSVLSMWICRVGMAYVFAQWLGMGAVGVWLAMMVDWLARSVFYVPRWLGGKWRSMRVV